MDANVRVVSMPCWELFAEQPHDYRDEVLPPDVRARLSVEAGITLGWERWVGDARRDRSRSTASAPRRPATRCCEQLGFTRRERRRARGGAARAGRGMKSRRRVRPPRREAARARPRGARGARPRGRSTSAPTPTRSGSTTRTRRRARRGDPRAATPSAACSSAARASAPPSPPARSPGSAPRSATTSTRPTRASSTTT